jgi:hypothetical protein
VCSTPSYFKKVKQGDNSKQEVGPLGYFFQQRKKGVKMINCFRAQIALWRGAEGPVVVKQKPASPARSASRSRLSVRTSTGVCSICFLVRCDTSDVKAFRLARKPECTEV